MPSENKNCWIFCNIIDNFGDIGVSLRLARILSHELSWKVHLWVDSFSELKSLLPNLSKLPEQNEGITFHRWTEHHAEDADSLPAPHIVIETFACNLPQNITALIAQHRPIWLNWEYLSAEASNERLHLMPSLQAGGIEKYFWFMGFSEVSGGLLRERNYHHSNATEIAAFRQHLKLPPKISPEWLVFSYKSPIWAKWFASWQKTGKALTLLLAGTQLRDELIDAGIIPPNALQNESEYIQLGNIRLIRLPFVAQKDFDKLLHLSDGMIIRGEDSFVRAQLSGKPFLWHIYPQQENIHLDKLSAFWEKVAPFYHAEIYEALQLLSHELNSTEILDEEKRLKAWQILQKNFPIWQNNATNWQQFLFSQQSAAEKLAKFIQNKLK